MGTGLQRLPVGDRARTARFGHWRRAARDRLSTDPVASRALRPLRALIPAAGYIPDFLTPSVTGGDLPAGLAKLRRTPRTRLVRDLLEGRGLLLVPSFFCRRRPVAPADPALDLVLVYPVEKAPLTVARATDDGVERLLGRTRSAVLAEVAGRRARTTSEVAAAVGIALPSASYQIGVLRDGGLVTSRRDGEHVLHAATALGQQLIGESDGLRPRTGAAVRP
ncbi:ArsR/SmtB family transcription factor [Streptomyces sp. NPDC005808]|uniref:ArsR/SmtB family transcription factor n=1 Tax=Streptomyces sp. NPDC005808 TaxID=3364734 RepID=UPI0036808FDC